jgi:hypothetical protein
MAHCLLSLSRFVDLYVSASGGYRDQTLISRALTGKMMLYLYGYCNRYKARRNETQLQPKHSQTSNSYHPSSQG